jgi:endoglucanase
MKRLAGFFLVFTLAIQLSAVSAAAEDTRTPVERYGRLAVDGNRLVDQNGKPVQLRGMSFFWSMAGGGEGCGFYNADVVKTLAEDWKVSVVRAAMGVDENWGTTSQGYLAGNKACGTTNDALVDTVVNAAIANGIYVIIDWHSHTAHTKAAQATTFFEEMARKYKGVPNVLYEIYNEPTTSGAAFWANSVKPYAQTVVSAIRAIDPQNVIIVGTPLYCQDVHLATANPLEGANIVYTLHFYSATHKDTLRMRADTALNKNNKALFVSEFGVSNAQANPPLDTAEATKWLDFLDSNKVSWVNWSISDKNKNGSGANMKDEITSAIVKGGSLKGGWADDQLTVSGKYIRAKLIAAYEAEQANLTSAQAAERVAPKPPQPGEAALIAIVNAPSGTLSAGPVPADRASGGVKFYWQGKLIKSGTLSVYDSFGNSVKSIRLSEPPANGQPKRAVGAWNLTDAAGRPVAAGSYLVKGKVTASDGGTVNVSAIVGVR